MRYSEYFKISDENGVLTLAYSVYELFGNWSRIESSNSFASEMFWIWIKHAAWSILYSIWYSVTWNFIVD
jgi:hypothetical protein